MERSDKFIDSLSDEGRSRLLIEAVTDYAIYMLNADGIITSWNPGAQRFKGYTADEIIGHHFSRFYREEDRRRGLPERTLATAREQGKFEGEGWRVRKDGTHFWAYVVVDPIRGPDGAVIGYAKITRDLSERRAAELALRASEEQFRLLVQNVTDYAICLLDSEGRIANWNLGAQRIKGYLPQEIIGSHFSRFYTPEDIAADMPAVALATAEREGRFEKEGWRVRKDGTRFWAHVVIDPVRNDAGELIGFAKITRDITERRDTQLALEKTREALVQSQKMEAIGQLTGGIAHDFNNLLMAVSSSLELMRKRLPDDPKLETLLNNAMQGTQRGATLTRRMLAFARRQDLKQEVVRIPELVGGMTELLNSSLGPSIEIETHFPLVLPAIRSDANQLEMSLLNLAVNARDAMPERGQIVIRAREEKIGEGQDLEPGSYVCLAVTDTGAGMDEATLKRAMEPFFTTKGVGKGTGLGLSMVHGFAEQSGGRFVLKSVKGQGTTAELWLPVAGKEPESAGARQEAPARRQASLAVIAVDDDFLVLTNTVAMLEDLGHTAIAAASGNEALVILEAGHAVDLVITDQAMPHMRGEQLAAAIEAKWPGLPVILATGYAEIEPGAARNLPRLSKPFTQGDLAAAIADIDDKIRKRARVVNFPRNGASPG
jgi:PAS domain S-box-containing protein